MLKSVTVTSAKRNVSVADIGQAGPKGPKGDKGDRGDIGPTGSNGVNVTTGNTPPISPAPGDVWIYTS